MYMEATRYVVQMMDLILADAWLDEENDNDTDYNTTSTIEMYTIYSQRDTVQSLLRERYKHKEAFSSAISSSLTIIENGYENRLVQRNLTFAVSHGTDYLHNNLQQAHEMDIEPLEKVVQNSAVKSTRGFNNDLLLQVSTTTLTLRKAVKYGQWSTIREALEAFDGVIESDDNRAHSSTLKQYCPPSLLEELDLMTIYSAANMEMHSDIRSVFTKNNVTGKHHISHMALDVENVDLREILYIQKKHQETPRISAEDELLWISLDKMKEVRSYIVMNDHIRLVDRVSHIHISSLHESCLEEACLVKKAVEFYINVEKVRQNVSTACITGIAGDVHIQGSSGSLLEKTLSVHNSDLCPPASRSFLTRAHDLVPLRESAKSETWDIQAAATVLLQFHRFVLPFPVVGAP